GHGMHRDSLPPRDIPDDRITGDGIAALGAIDHDVVGAADFDREIPWNRRLLGRLIGGGRRLLRFGGLGVHKLIGRSALQYVAGGELPVAQTRVQVLYLAIAVFAGDALELGFRNTAERHAEPAGLLLEILFADFYCLGSLGGVDDMLDLVAGARR